VPERKLPSLWEGAGEGKITSRYYYTPTLTLPHWERE